MKPKQIVSADEASEIAVEAYVFGYPLVLMDVTHQVMTAVPRAGAHKAPVNQFIHIREFPDYTMTDVVSPNADTLYSTAWLDLTNEPIPNRQLPPVNAFWSLTMYNSKQFFAQNPISRYATGDRDKLKFNDDGSLTINIQRESPGKDKESNWLPAPAGSFNVFMRLYWPKKEIVDGAWKMPGVERVK